jgi:hypothetical protein
MWWNWKIYRPESLLDFYTKDKYNLPIFSDVSQAETNAK